jgi:hypothetical protein
VPLVSWASDWRGVRWGKKLWETDVRSVARKPVGDGDDAGEFVDEVLILKGVKAMGEDWVGSEGPRIIAPRRTQGV